MDWASRHHRTSDPDTSKSAAASVETTALKQCASIYEEIWKEGGPLAAEQIADILDLTHVQVNRRLPDLEHQGRIVKTSQRHTNRSGRKAVKWGVAPRPFRLEG